MAADVRWRGMTGLAARCGATAYLATLGWLGLWVLIATLVPGWTPVAISSGSMNPAIREGDVVVSAGVPPGEVLRTGEVIVFSTGGALVTHRVEAPLGGGRYVTRGDANASADAAPVHSGQVVGRGRLLIPWVGRPVLWLTRGQLVPLVTWLLATVGSVLLIATWRGEAPGVPAPCERQGWSTAPARTAPALVVPSTAALGEASREGSCPT